MFVWSHLRRVPALDKGTDSFSELLSLYVLETRATISVQIHQHDAGKFTDLELGDAKLSGRGLPGTVTGGQSTGTPCGASLNSVENGHVRVGVTAASGDEVRYFDASRHEKKCLQRNVVDSVMSKEGQGGKSGSLLSSVLRSS